MIVGLHSKNMFSFVKNHQTLSKCVYHFAFPPAVSETSYCFKCFSAFGVVGECSGFAHSSRCVVVSRCYFNLHFPDDKCVGHHFICLFAVCLSLVRCKRQFFGPVLNKMLVFLLLSFKKSLFVMDSGPLSDVSFANISS